MLHIVSFNNRIMATSEHKNFSSAAFLRIWYLNIKLLINSFMTSTTCGPSLHVAHHSTLCCSSEGKLAEMLGEVYKITVSSVGLSLDASLFSLYL